MPWQWPPWECFLSGRHIPKLAMTRSMIYQHTIKQSQCIMYTGSALMMNLIGKKLDNKNYSNWIKRRMRSYAAPLWLSSGPGATLCFEFHPSQALCSTFHDNVRIYWEIRRLFFENIYGISRREDLLAQGCRITVSLLRGAEMSNWSFIGFSCSTRTWSCGMSSPNICHIFAQHMRSTWASEHLAQ